ncbi:MAG TPA: hypothetical protein VIX73_06970 [Kofleriaceae bacterium]|jgi:hypothetical protein
MKPIKSFLVLAILCIPALASAQGYYGPRQGTTVPGGFHNRAGRLTFGIGGGLGGMHDDTGSIGCASCDFNVLAAEGDFHIGGMVSPRLGFMLEGQFNSQQVDANTVNGDVFLTQGALMFAAQFWVIPQLWIKGGIGGASLHVDDAFFTNDAGTGGALLGAAGVEVFSARNFAFEVQGRIIEGLYSHDYHVTSGTIGLGINWY